MPVKSKTEILTNMVGDKVQLARVINRIVKIVAQSFKEDKDRISSDVIVLSTAHNPTRAEIQTRTNMCYDLFMAMRYDLHYSTSRALDTIPKALRVQLDGGKWEPQSERQAWGTSEA